jgi:hypothetical protein
MLIADDDRTLMEAAQRVLEACGDMPSDDRLLVALATVSIFARRIA